MLKGIASILVILSLQVFVVSSTTPTSVAQMYFRGVYRNQKYGYSMAIPNGFVGMTDPPPAPQHGISILLKESPKEQIWIDASYNAALWPTVEAAMNRHIEWLRKESDGIVQLSRRTTRLDSLMAVRDVTHYEDRVTGEAMVQDLTLAMRNAKHDGQILYTIGLRTRESTYKEHKLLLEYVIDRWRRERLSN